MHLFIVSENLSLIFLLAVAFVGYQLYQGGAVSSGKSRKKLR